MIPLTLFLDFQVLSRSFSFPAHDDIRVVTSSSESAALLRLGRFRGFPLLSCQSAELATPARLATMRAYRSENNAVPIASKLAEVADGITRHILLSSTRQFLIERN